MTGDVLSFISDLFYGPFFSMAEWVWNWIMGLCTGIITQTPQGFSPETWEFVTETFYPWVLGIGVLLVNLSFLIGMCRSVTNLREQVTLEACVETLIRLVAVNVLMQAGLELMQTFFTMAGGLAGRALTFQAPAFYTSDADIGSHLFWWILGLGYFVVAVVCAVMIFLTLYGRYVKLYLLVLFYPIAMPLIVGGRELEHNGYAWVRTFLSNVFEIVAIALVMSITGRLVAGVSLPAGPVTQYFDGFVQAMHSLVYMILMTSSVKGASALMNRAFGL